jgi:hypothetical protein
MTFEIIHTYTRAQAIADGVLKDVTETAREAGFTHHTVVTEGVWNQCVALSEAARNAGCDERGRLWDVVWMASCAARKAARGKPTDRVEFQIYSVVDRIEPELVDLWLHCGPGDNGEPVLTIMLQGED